MKDEIYVIEGGDAVGKFTQSTMLAEKLKGTRFAFPNYESETGKAILAHLKKEWKAMERDGVGRFDIRASCDDLVFQCLQTANRLERLPEIAAALVRGPVVFDRYWQSAYVYGSLDGLNKDWLRRVQEAPMPQATWNVLIDAPVEESWKRRPERRDRYEMDREFAEQVRARYLELWGIDRQSDFERVQKDELVISGPRCSIVNGIGTTDEVHARVLRAIGYGELVNREGK